MLLFGALLSWIPILGLFGGLFTLIGAVLVILGRKAFGAMHRRNVAVSILLFVLGYLVAFIAGIAAGVWAAAALTGSTTEAELATVLQTVMTNMVVAAAIGPIFGALSSVFFTYALQKAEGRIMLWAAYAAILGIQVAILLITILAIPLLAAVMASAVSTGRPIAPSEIVSAVSAVAGGLWPLSVVPALLYAGANYLAWTRINQGEIP